MFDYGEYRPNSYAKYNLLASMPHDKSEIKRDAASLRGFIQITPIKELAYKMSLNIDYNNKTNHNYTNPTYGTKKKVKWSSNKKTIATVTRKGKVTAQKPGTAL